MVPKVFSLLGGLLAVALRPVGEVSPVLLGEPGAGVKEYRDKMVSTSGSGGRPGGEGHLRHLWGRRRVVKAERQEGNAAAHRQEEWVGLRGGEKRGGRLASELEKKNWEVVRSETDEIEAGRGLWWLARGLPSSSTSARAFLGENLHRWGEMEAPGCTKEPK